MKSKDQSAQAQPDGSDDLAELERARQAYRAARKRLGMSYAPRVAAAVVAGLLLFGAGGGGMYLLLNGEGAGAQEDAEKIASLQDELDKTKDKLEDATSELKDLKSKDNAKDKDGDESASDSKAAAASESSSKSAAYDPASLVGTWTGTFEDTQSLMGEDCLFGRSNPAKLVVKTWNPDTRIFDADLTVAYHGHYTKDIGAQTQTVAGDAVQEYKNISGTIESNGMATWNFTIDGQDAQHAVDVTLEVEGIDEGSISAKMIVRSYFGALVEQVKDTYELTRS